MQTNIHRVTTINAEAGDTSGNPVHIYIRTSDEKEYALPTLDLCLFGLSAEKAEKLAAAINEAMADEEGSEA